MSYADKMSVVEQPATTELYKIKLGNIYLYITSGDVPVHFKLNNYQPAPIKRGHFALDRSMKTVDLTLNIPVTIAFGEHISKAPYNSTIVELYRVFLAAPDTDAKLLFTGSVERVTVKDFVAQVLVRSVNRTLSRKFPRFFYQTTCNHMIFDSGCGLLRQDFRLPAVIASIGGSQVVVDDLPEFADNALQGGILVVNGEERLITTQTGTTLNLLVPLTGAEPGMEVDLYPGCDGNPGTCRGYNNIQHFFGMPYIPTRNPVLWGFR